MNTNSKYSPALLTITGFVILFLIFGWLYIENEKEDHRYTISQINNKSDKLLQSDSYRKQELHYNGKLVSHLISDSNTVMELKSMVDNNKLIMFLHEYMPNTDMEIENLSENMQKYKDDIILFVKSDTKRNVSIFKNNKKLEYPCVHIRTNEDSSYIKKTPLIYFILEKETLRINASFIPNSEKKEETIRYYEKITADYFTND